MLPHPTAEDTMGHNSATTVQCSSYLPLLFWSGEEVVCDLAIDPGVSVMCRNIFASKGLSAWCNRGSPEQYVFSDSKLTLDQ